MTRARSRVAVFAVRTKGGGTIKNRLPAALLPSNLIEQLYAEKTVEYGHKRQYAYLSIIAINSRFAHMQ